MGWPRTAAQPQPKIKKQWPKWSSPPSALDLHLPLFEVAYAAAQLEDRQPRWHTVSFVSITFVMFPCTAAGCQKWYGSEKALRKHYRLHHATEHAPQRTMTRRRGTAGVANRDQKHHKRKPGVLAVQGPSAEAAAGSAKKKICSVAISVDRQSLGGGGSSGRAICAQQIPSGALFCRISALTIYSLF